MLTIKTFHTADTKEVIRLVLHCQNDGTRTLFTVENQPDLLQINEEYIRPGGNFWVAKSCEKLAGCIGLKNYGNGIGVLKKFFVYEAYRSKPHHLGQQLYATLLAFAKQNGFSTLVLDTPPDTDRAHKFYAKAGWQQIAKEDLPISYAPPYANSHFFRIDL